MLWGRKAKGPGGTPRPAELASLPTKVIEEGGPSLVDCVVAAWLHGVTKGRPPVS
jgi:hypothetical protein